MSKNLPLPLSQAEAATLAARLHDAISSVESRFVADRGHNAATINREIEHILRREAARRAPQVTEAVADE